jgi:uncharacterized protein YggE
MKNSTLITLVILIAWCTVQAQQFDDRPKIMVNGEAVVKVQPDQIIITFGIETWDKEIMLAKQKNNDIMQKALNVIKDAGIPDKDIQTDYLSVEPRYYDSYEKKDFIGYFIRNTFVVTLSNPEKVEELVKRSSIRVNYIHGIDFQTTEFKIP